MLFLARELHLHSGERLNNYVLKIDDGKVVDMFPFESECAAMQLVDVVVIKSSPAVDGEIINEDTFSEGRAGRYLCAYSVAYDGTLHPL